jgi:hypothetical protein
MIAIETVLVSRARSVRASDRGQPLAAMWRDAEDAPVSVGIVFDTSGSMGAKLGISRQAVAQFLTTANPEDEFFLVEFNDRADMTATFTTFPEEFRIGLRLRRHREVPLS